MKKVFLTLSLALLCLGAFAQSADEFFPGWYLGAKGGISLTAGETHANNLLSPRAALDLGYQFTPVFGLRGQLSTWEGKGALPLYDEKYKFNFGQLNLDAMFDLCNLFGKYKYNRVVNPYLFAGIGFNTRFNNKEAQAIKADFPEKNWLWDNPVLSFCGRFGLGADFRLTDGLALSLELTDNVLTDHFNSKVGDAWTLFGGVVDFDYQLTALAGLKFSFGAAKRRAAALAAAEAAAAEAAAAAAAKAAAEKAAAEKAALERAAAEKAAAEKAAADRLAAEKAAAEAARAKARAAVENVYFTINKYNINPSEVEKIDHIIAVMKQYPEAVVSITGYADKATGTAKRNLFLSEQRAAVVCQCLLDAGISQDRITTNYYGDTKQVSEIPEENRVSICVTR